MLQQAQDSQSPHAVHGMNDILQVVCPGDCLLHCPCMGNGAAAVLLWLVAQLHCMYVVHMCCSGCTLLRVDIWTLRQWLQQHSSIALTWQQKAVMQPIQWLAQPCSCTVLDRIISTAPVSPCTCATMQAHRWPCSMCLRAVISARAACPPA